MNGINYFWYLYLDLLIINIRLLDLSVVHFTVVCLVTWPMNESEAGVDLVLIETSLPAAFLM